MVGMLTAGRILAQSDRVSDRPGDFASLLRSARKARKMSIGQLAKRAKVSRQFVSMVERKERFATKDRAVTLARALEADPVHFSTVAERDWLEHRGDELTVEAADTLESVSAWSLVSLGYVIDSLSMEVTIEPNGDTRTIRQYMGCRPVPGAATPLEELRFAERGGPPTDPGIPMFSLLEAPDGVRYRVAQDEVQGNVHVHKILFTNGWTVERPDTPGFSFAFETRRRQLFSTAPGVGTVGFSVPHPLRKLRVALRFSPQLPSPEWSPEIQGRLGALPAEAVPPVAVTQLCRTITFKAEGHEALLEVGAPVLNSTYVISWRHLGGTPA